MTKNHQGGATSCDRDEAVTCGRIQDPTQVKAWKRLLEKLNPKMDQLFQRALSAVKDSGQPCWFAASPLGKNTLDRMTARICEAAGTGERYTNHSVRVTAVSRLNEAGFSDREICAITRHRSSDSLQSGITANSEKRKLMAAALDCQFPSKRPWEGSATVSEQACESSLMLALSLLREQGQSSRR